MNMEMAFIKRAKLVAILWVAVILCAFLTSCNGDTMADLEIGFVAPAPPTDENGEFVWTTAEPTPDTIVLTYWGELLVWGDSRPNHS